ncbi:transglutaminase family protein [Haloferula sargassicola]|uniref:Uncharacterized protein Rv2569c n=1 Tax=Haloferula sargassicola TaxID=490096 RepID=A0ABP9UQV2_9BACT
MKRFNIIHRTYYTFAGPVTLGTHELRLRPRENHDLRIESCSLNISPTPEIRWHRDIEDNSVATAEFSTTTLRLAVESEVVIQQFNQRPLDFLVAPHAAYYPFDYTSSSRSQLHPYLNQAATVDTTRWSEWLGTVRKPGQKIQTYTLLEGITHRIHREFRYRTRDEQGVQDPEQTLALGSGSCRDFATLFIATARRLGLAARFVSGYLNAPPSSYDYGATHAWVDVYLPGAGWKGFDPTLGRIAGADHIAVAVAADPESVPPISGSFVGQPGTFMDVGVWVSEI